MKDVYLFRNNLAEQGYEYTPDEAASILEHVEIIQSAIRNQLYSNPELRYSLMNPDMKVLKKQLLDSGIKVSNSELNDVVKLMQKLVQLELGE